MKMASLFSVIYREGVFGDVMSPHPSWTGREKDGNRRQEKRERTGGRVISPSLPVPSESQSDSVFSLMP